MKGVAVCALAVAAASSSAFADPVDEAGLSPRANARAGAQAASADDFSAAWYNPALLDGQVGSFSLGYVVEDPRVSIQTLGHRKFAKYTPPEASDGSVIGLVVPLAGKLKKRVTFGLALYLPRTSQTHLQLTDQTQPQWVAFDEDPRRLMVVPSLGGRVWRGLSLGAGIDVLSNFVGDAHLTIDPDNKEVRDRNYANDLIATTSPIVGFAYDFGRFKLGGMYHHEMKLPFHLPIDAFIDGLGDLVIDAQGLADYSPPRFALGGRLDTGWRGLVLDGEAEVQLWHLAPDPVYDVTIDSPGLLGQILGPSISGDDVTPGYRDTFVARLAGELPIRSRGHGAFGCRYRPTPLPAQTGPTNFLDSDTLACSVGGSWTIDDPLELADGGIRFDAAFTGAWLIWQGATKSNDNDVSYRYGGWQWSATASATFLWSK